jgi:hypothetical protein
MSGHFSRSYDRPWLNRERARMTSFGGKNAATWTGKLHRVTADGQTIKGEDVVLVQPRGSGGRSSGAAAFRPSHIVIFVGSEC